MTDTLIHVYIVMQLIARMPRIKEASNRRKEREVYDDRDKKRRRQN